ncbi:MAG: PKD domain-containing protein, partial [Bacteroidota bacterium]
TTDSVGLGTIQFTDVSTNTPTAWLWDFGDGNTSTQQNPAHTYAAEGQYTVCLTATNQFGTDSTCAMVTLANLRPAVTFTTDSVGLGTIQFTDVSTNTPTAWLWDFGDGNTSTMQNPSHTFPAEGTYTVCLTSTNSFGSDSSCASVLIQNVAPAVDFTIMALDSGQFQFTDATTNMPTAWLWDFGDGNTSTMQNPSYRYIATGDYTVCLTATNTFATDSACAVVSVVITNLPTSLPGTTLLIGPNPFKGQLNIQLQGQLPSQALRMRIFSNNGRLMGNYRLRDQISIPTEDWPSGSYWLQLRDERGNRVLETQVIRQ